jgi:transposase
VSMVSRNPVMGTNKRRRHRAWPESVKREIVAATLLPGSSVARVARRYDVNANQVFAWRRRYRDGAAAPAELRLLPVTVTPDHPEGMAPARTGELIEIVLAGGYRLRVGEGIQAATLRLVLDVLERR